MEVYVMSADRRNGIGKKSGIPYDSIVVQGVYSMGNKFSVRELWINPDMTGGAVPQYGDILDVHVDFGGYVQSVSFVEKKKFALNVRPVNG